MNYPLNQNCISLDENLINIIQNLNSIRNPRTSQAIKNAWIKGTYFRNDGAVMIKYEFLHTLLRVPKNTVNFLLAKFNLSNLDVITGSDFISLISQIFDTASTFKKRDYIRFSESLYYEIRDFETAEVLRGRYYEDLKDKKKNLKRERQNHYSLKYDELTGLDLNYQSAEFSHIRSVAMYPDLQLEIENGLIVNKETHDIITKENVQNENDLYSLCIKKNWDISWYYYYKNWLQ